MSNGNTGLLFAAKKIIIFFVLFFLAKNCSCDVCRDREILDLLKNDVDTPECIIDGKYYRLPCTLKDFENNGWAFDYEKEDIADEEQIVPGTVFQLIYGGLVIYAVNASEDKISMGDMEVVQIRYTRPKQNSVIGRENFFVTKYGITEKTNWRTVNRLFKKSKTYTPSNNSNLGWVPSESLLRSEANKSIEVLKVYYDSKDYYNTIIVSSTNKYELAHYFNEFQKESGHLFFRIFMRNR